MPGNWEKADRIFKRALELEGAALETFLAENCNGDSALTAEVRRFLELAEQSTEFLETSPDIPMGADTLSLRSAAESGFIDSTSFTEIESDTRLGAYRVVKLIGKGGMGSVYLAERADGQFEQVVAIKVMHEMRGEPQRVARFLRERQILASLEHPNIAHLLDGGVTDDDRPYFVMEYVEGEDVVQYCKDSELALADRLILFRRICHAVQFAHDKGIIHRDIKPKNIVVNAQGQVKLLDFGIAQLLDTESEDNLTQTGLAMVTPSHASPEQIRGQASTRLSDVYQLGLVLYQLFAGRLPMGESPKPPSLALGGPRASDLDRVCLKALAAEPDDRYTSARALADDIERYLVGQPVSAKSPSIYYRAQRFLGRNRVAVLLATLVAAMTLAVGFWSGRAAPPTPGPGDEFPDKSIAVLPFDVLSDRNNLVYFATGLEEELIHQLATDPGLHVIARTSSARFGDKTHSIREISEQLGVRHVIEGSVRDTQDGMRITVQLIDAETDAHLWSRVFDAGQDNLIEVQELVSEAVGHLLASGASQTQRVGVGRETWAAELRHPVPDAAYRLFLLGEAHMRVDTADAFDKAGRYFSDAIQIAPSYALAWSRLAASYLLRYQYSGFPLDEASALAAKALERALEIDPDQPEALATSGLMYTYNKQFQEAERYFEQALERQPRLRFALHNYGFALWSQSKYEEATVTLRKAIQIDPLSGTTHFLLADSLAGTGDFDGSMAQYRNCKVVLREYHTCALGHSTLQRLTGDYQGAVDSLQYAASLTGADNFWQLLSSGLLAIQLGQLESAGQYLSEASTIFPQDYVLLRGKLQLSLASGKLNEFLETIENLSVKRVQDRTLGLIGGLAWFHAGQCSRALESYQPHLGDARSFLVDIWDAELGFSHAVALAYCYGQIGDQEKREDVLAWLRISIERFPAAPIFAQRYLAASYAQLSGQPDEAQHDLDRLSEDNWPLIWITQHQPVFH